MFLNLLLNSDNGMSRNNANSIKAKKIVMSDELILCKPSTLYNNNPNIMEENISAGSSFSDSSILSP